MEKDIINTNHEEQCEESFSIPVELDFTEFDKKLTTMQEALSEVLSDVLAQAIADPDSNLDLKELLSDENASDEERNFADYEYEEEEEDDYDDEEDNIYDEEDDYYDEEDSIYDEEDDYYDEEDSIYDEEEDYYDEEDSIYDEEEDYYDEEDDIYDEEEDYYNDEDDYDDEDVYKDSFYDNNEYQPDNIYNHRDKTSRSSHFTPLFGSHKSQSSHESTSRNASSYNPFDTHGESSFDWTDRDGDGYDDRDDGFWTEREF